MLSHLSGWLRWLPVLLLGACGTTGGPLPVPVGVPDEPVRLPPDLSRPAATVPLKPPPLGEREVRAMVARLIGPTVRDREVWAGDLYSVFSKLDFPHAPEIYCAAIAVIEQESSFQADPAVPGLPAIVWKELEQRGRKFGIPKLLISAAMLKTSPDGRSYSQRIDALKTEKQLNALFQDLITELPAGRQLLSGYNPVRTGGPMQVSVEFAEQQARDKPYPYRPAGSIRDEVFSRRGGLYFGSAILLDYPAPYNNVIYRFADFNAGRYSSRNAAFQSALGRLSGKPLELDGDLLRYAKGQAVATPSGVELAARNLSGKLRLTPGEIRRDLLLEKSAEFGQSPLYKRLFSLADQAMASPAPRQVMPQIDLQSPKITRKLTTEWFARRVDGRYRACLGRADSAT
ncbi:DUF1615 domain-containing protein [Azonexus sp. IMCC34842]|uniref:DUF1615 domain-containing protein n=1 Tax=Azonexus sp. IMCC34842 TaxID=3420950 RepID=UPI003D120B83